MAQTAVGKVDAFIQALKAHTPYGSTLQTESEVEVLDINTGEMQAVLATTPAAPAQSTQAVGMKYTAASGAVINWKTNELRNGRRMRGRTFLVPLGISVVENNGSLENFFLESMNAAAAALRSTTGGSNLMVYGRPSGPNATDGTVGGVISHNIPDLAAVLRSRRD